VINTTNRLNDYILGEIETGTKEPVFCRDVKQVLTPGERNRNFTAHTKTDAIAHII